MMWRLVYSDGSHGAWSRDFEEIKRLAKFFNADIEEKA